MKCAPFGTPRVSARWRSLRCLSARPKTPSMSFYRYLEGPDVHVVDCSGRVDLQIGIERLELLQAALAARPSVGGVRRLLIDFRNTVWENEDVHRQLSEVTRRDFGLNADNRAIRAAILNHRWEGPLSDNERWFFEEGPALEWLVEPD